MNDEYTPPDNQNESTPPAQHLAGQNQRGESQLESQPQNVEQMMWVRNQRMLKGGSVSGLINTRRLRRIVGPLALELRLEGYSDQRIYIMVDIELDLRGVQVPPMMLKRELKKWGVYC